MEKWKPGRGTGIVLRAASSQLVYQVPLGWNSPTGALAKVLGPVFQDAG